MSIPPVPAFTLVLAACNPTPVLEQPHALVIEGLGSTSVRISTGSARAPRFFDQGIVLALGIDHAEPARSFSEASRLDPQRLLQWLGRIWAGGRSAASRAARQSAAPPHGPTQPELNPTFATRTVSQITHGSRYVIYIAQAYRAPPVIDAPQKTIP
jgi:hypothetical protein